MPRNALAAAILLGALISACGSALSLTHTETPCVTPGGTVTLQTTTDPGTVLSYKVQDDFGGGIGTLGPVTAGSDGKASITWQAPAALSTTTIHFILAAANGDKRASRDLHVVVGGNGRSC
jgi:hypothetical protein